MTFDVVVPSFGGTGGDVTLAEWLVKPGDKVKAGAPLFVLETDKANVEVEAFRDGYVRELLVASGTTVALGANVAVLSDSADEPASHANTQPGVPKTTGEQQVSLSAQRAAPQPKAPLISPLAKRMAREMGVDLSSITGTSEGARIHKRDVLAAAAQAHVSQPGQAVRATSGGVRHEKVSPMRRAVAERTSQSKSQAPHFYVTATIDMTDAQAFLKQASGQAEKNGWSAPSITDLAIRAAAVALKATPQLNASYHGDDILYFEDINIGLVVALAEGMIVSVLHNADRLNLYTIAARTKRLRERAAAGQLSSTELSGATFTISNLGRVGVDGFIAVINPPEAAILAMGAARVQPAVWEGQIVPRSLMAATLSADHRLVDGVIAARFLGELKQLLQNPLLLALEPPEEATA